MLLQEIKFKNHSKLSSVVDTLELCPIQLTIPKRLFNVQETILCKPKTFLGEDFHIMICIRYKLSKSYILKTARVI